MSKGVNIKFARKLIREVYPSEKDIILAIDLLSQELSSRAIEVCILTLRKRKEISISLETDPLEDVLDRNRSQLQEIFISDEDEESENEDPSEPDVAEIEEEPVPVIIRPKSKAKVAKNSKAHKPKFIDISADNKEEMAEDVDSEPKTKSKSADRKLPPNTAPVPKAKVFPPKWLVKEYNMHTLIEKLKSKDKEAGYIYENGTDTFYLGDKTFILSRTSPTVVNAENFKASFTYNENGAWIVTDVVFSY